MNTTTHTAGKHTLGTLTQAERDKLQELVARREASYWEYQRTFLQGGLTLLSVGAPLCAATGMTGTQAILMGTSLSLAFLGVAAGFYHIRGQFRLDQSMVEACLSRLQSQGAEDCSETRTRRNRVLFARLSKLEQAAGRISAAAIGLSFLLLIAAAFVR